MAFGTYASTAASSAQSTISVTCTNLTTYTLGLDPGIATGATETARSMTGTTGLGTGALLPYGLYSDAGHTSNWGNISGTWVGGTGNGSAQSLTVYGQVAAGHLVPPGDYADTITATVTY
jgi:spore coat protein U-like protein